MNRRREGEIPTLLEDCKKLGWELTSGMTTLTGKFGLKIQIHAQGFTPEDNNFIVHVESVPNHVVEKAIACGMRDGYPTVYGHCQLAMGYARVSKCGVLLSGDNGVIYVEMIKFDQAIFDRMEGLIETLTGVTPPAPIATSECDKCFYNDACYSEDVVPPLNCHTCLHAHWRLDKLSCGRWKKDVPETVWADGCTEHLYMPNLLNFAKTVQIINLENGEKGVKYETSSSKVFINCGSKAVRQENSEMMVTSREIFISGKCLLENDLVHAIKTEFSGSTIINKQ